MTAVPPGSAGTARPGSSLLRGFRAPPLLALLLLAAALASCGYSVGPLQPANDARSIALPLFDNRTYRRGVETDLGRALASEVHSRTRLRIVETGADLILEGTIVEIREILLSQAEKEVTRESTVLVTVEFVVKDGRTGQPLAPRDKISEREAFVPGIGESLLTARGEALRRLAADLVDRLEAP